VRRGVIGGTGDAGRRVGSGDVGGFVSDQLDLQKKSDGEHMGHNQALAVSRAKERELQGREGRKGG